MNQEELDKEIEYLVDLIMEYKRQSDGEDILMEYRELFMQASLMAEEDHAREEEERQKTVVFYVFDYSFRCFVDEVDIFGMASLVSPSHGTMRGGFRVRPLSRTSQPVCPY